MPNNITMHADIRGVLDDVIVRDDEGTEIVRYTDVFQTITRDLLDGVCPTDRTIDWVAGDSRERALQVWREHAAIVSDYWDAIQVTGAQLSSK